MDVAECAAIPGCGKSGVLVSSIGVLLALLMSVGNAGSTGVVPTRVSRPHTSDIISNVG
jgi:hypothetical protein